MPLDEDARTSLLPYVSSASSEVFALIGLPEEEVAALFAHASRSQDSLRTTLGKLLASGELESRRFRAAALGAYGHASAHEHAVVHLGVEGVSVVVSKLIEDARLASFTERLTRATPIDPTRFVELPELGDLEPVYRATVDRLIAAYVDLVPKTAAILAGRLPQAAVEAGLEPRALASDLLRGLLPAGLKTQIAITANARALGGLVTKLASSGLAEARRIAEGIRVAAETIAPGISAYAQPSAHRASLNHEVNEVLRFIYTPPPENATATMVVHQPVRIIRWDRDALERVVLALTYEGSDPRAHASGIVDGLRQASPSELEQLVRAALKHRGPNDPPPRGFEASTMTVELMLDYATFRELQRHRLLTPSTQRLTCRLGFETPGPLVDLGGYEAYADAMLAARDAWTKIEARFPHESQYAIPIGYRVRTLWTLDLREMIHVIEMRSKKTAHSSDRRIAQGLYRSACAALPWLKDMIRVDFDPSVTGF